MKKTLILCFIHGFKGGDDTFGDDYRFTEDLRSLVAEALPKVSVKVLVYPKYETRGDLGDCVSRFRDWLQEKVIDMEVAAATPSPTIDPSVRTILVGHSMGGIQKGSDVPAFNSSLMFPYIQGVLAFDTPYLGISPGVVAHGAEGHYQNAAAAYGAMSQLSGLGSALWGGAGSAATAAAGAKAVKPSAGALPAPPSQGNSSGSAWQKWGKMAMYAGAAGAVAAGGAAAWLNRDQISEGLTWATSHLEFVGSLARPEELKKRVNYMVRVSNELEVGFANLYTRLGRAAPSKEVSMVGTVLGKNRTFCNLPNKQKAGNWQEAVNDKVADEVGAHMGMFTPKDNPGYDRLVQDATGLIAAWLKNDWYETSAEPRLMLEAAPAKEEEKAEQGEQTESLI